MMASIHNGNHPEWLRALHEEGEVEITGGR